MAEDNPTNQQVAQAILEGAGITVTIVSNGEAAVQAVRSAPFDAVLMDIQMPRMNGYEATRLIRELPQGASLPIIAMTAHAMKGDEEKCLDAGMDGYISKPVNQDRLFHTLWRLLRTREHTSASTAMDGRGTTGGTETGGDNKSADGHRQPSGSTTEHSHRLPDRLPGIDIARTREALNLDGPTLKRILVGFRADNRDTANQMNRALTGNDTERMRQLAHGLKGSAANIGADRLHEAAGALEAACDGNPATDVRPSPIEGLVAGVAADLNQVLEAIASDGGDRNRRCRPRRRPWPSPVCPLTTSWPGWPTPSTGPTRKKF